MPAHSSFPTPQSAEESVPDDCLRCLEKVGVKRRRKRHSRKWHRWMGLLTALPLIWVLATGVVLNHTVALKLDDIEVNHPWVMAAYGMNPSGEPLGQQLESFQVATWDGIIFLNGKPLELTGELLGAVSDGEGLAIVTDRSVLRLDSSGETIELLDEISLPELPLTGVAMDAGVVLLKNNVGWHEVSDGWLETKQRDQAPFSAVALSEIENEESRETLRQAWTRGGLPASRIVLDLHSGRFLGAFGVYFYDFVAVCTALLTVTGLVLFFRKPRRRNTNTEE